MIIFVALQGSVAKYLPQFNRIDLTLILTVYLSLKRKPLQGTLVGAGAGYAHDLVTGGRLLGASSFTKTVIGFVISSINVHFAIDHKLTRLFILVIASIVNVLLFLGLLSIFHAMPLEYTPREIVKLTAWQAAGNLILGFFLFPILDRIFVEQPYTSSRRAAQW